MGAVHTHKHVLFSHFSLAPTRSTHAFGKGKAPSATSPTKAAHSGRFFCPYREKKKKPELGKKKSTGEMN